MHTFTQCCYKFITLKHKQSHLTSIRKIIIGYNINKIKKLLLAPFLTKVLNLKMLC